MKLTLFIIILSISSLRAEIGYSQSTRLNLNLNNASVKDALMKIEEKSDFFFLFNSKLINVNRKVTVNVKNERIDDILKQIFEETDVVYTVVDKQIILTNKENLEGFTKLAANLKKQLALKGKVTSATDGQALPGVNILVKGVNNGAITDMEGNYSLDVDENATLIFSFMGYITQEIPVNGQSVINVVLEEDSKGLDEVVVIGYGTVKKSDLTGSVSSVSSDQLTSFPASGAVQALQGRAAGVQIQSNNGDPGGSMKVRVRGGTSINASSDPLYVVDGFVGAAIPQPEDIQSMEILKDASGTAIYGSRGANGVIMITTKKGTKGKSSIEYNTSYSVQKEIKRLDMLNASQYTDMTLEVIPAYISSGAETDWQDIIFQQGAIKTHQLSFSGGSENMNYYVSGSYFDQKGIIINSGFKKYSVTSNINMDVTKRLKVGLNIFGQRSSTNGVPTQEGSGGASDAGVVGSALRFMPDQPIYNADGTYTVAAQGDPIDNPYAIVNEYDNNNVADRLQGNFYAEYTFMKGLAFKTTLGISTFNNRNGEYYSTLLNKGRSYGGLASINSAKNTNLASENYLTYNTTIAGKHDLGAMIGYTYQTYKNESWGAVNSSFVTDAVSYWNLGGGAVTQLPNSNLTEGELASFYGRFNYGFDSRYILTFNARYDGSSNFSENHKWAFFPSGAFAWNMKNEDFMKNVDAISQLKWRASYGITGNQAIGAYWTLARLSSVFTVVNGVQVNAVRPSTVANDNLTWESTAQMDIGLDIGFLGNRLNLTADYYQKITSDLLFTVPLPLYSGYPSQWQNIGKFENKGIELTLSGKIFTGEFKWNMDFNIAANRNKVLELPDGKDIKNSSGPGHLVSLGNTQIMREGQPLGSFYGYIYDGVYQEGDKFISGSGFEQVAGGEKYSNILGVKDANGNLTGEADTILNTDDQTIIGNPEPKFFYGFNNEFQYKDFDLSIFIQGSYGNDILSYTLLELETLGSPINSTTRALDRWTPSNTNTDVPKKTASRSQKVSTRWVFDGSYMRVKNIVLGYNLPKSVLQKVKIQKLRLYVSAQNILTFTKYRGFDPEVNYRGSGSGAQSNLNQGLDYASYPNAKSFTFGLNLVF